MFSVVFFRFIGFSGPCRDRHWDMRAPIISIPLILALSGFPGGLFAEEASFQQTDRQTLEYRVKQLMSLDVSTQRQHIGEIFLLADVYSAEGKMDEAVRLYRDALKLDGWQLAYQLKLAQLLVMRGEKTEAVEKLKFVYQYSEEEEETDTAEKLAQGLGVELPQAPKPSHLPAPPVDFDIILVPIGSVNSRLLEGVRERLQYETGIRYTIAADHMNPGTPDRTQSQFVFNLLVDSMKEAFSRPKFYVLLSKYNLTEEKAKTREGFIELLQGLAQEQGIPLQQSQEFSNMLKQLEDEAQYDAERLMETLMRTYPPQKEGKPRGYIGVTGSDIFGSQSFSLMGQVGPRYGVLSYRRLQGAPNGEAPNRQRLSDRFVKNALYLSFAIFGIENCPTPTCARSASPGTGLAGLDQVEAKLCDRCLQRLSVLPASEAAAPKTTPAQEIVIKAAELKVKGQHDDALELCRQALEIDPASVEAQLLMARIYDDTSRDSEALDLYKKLLDRYPKNEYVITSFMWFCADHTWWIYGDDDELVVKERMKAGDRFYQTQAQSPEFLEAFGWFCYQAREFEKAITLFQGANAYEKTPVRLFLLSAAAGQLNKWDLALPSYKEAQWLQRGRQETEREFGFRQLAESSLRASKLIQ